MEFIPFGNNCTPADILRAGDLRKHSLPFDWIFAYPDNIKRSLDTDFQEWFDTSLMQTFNDDPVMENRKWTKHSFYRAHTNDHIAGFFNHHDLTDPKTQDMYCRRIDRFKSIIASNEHIVFVTMATPQEIADNGLSNYFNRTGKITFLYLDWIKSDKYEVEPSMSKGIIKITYHSPVQFDETVGMMVSDKIHRIFDPFEE